MEPLISIKPLSLLLKWCFYSQADPALIELMLQLSHRTIHVTSQPVTCDTWPSRQSSLDSQGFVMVWLARATNTPLNHETASVAISQAHYVDCWNGWSILWQAVCFNHTMQSRGGRWSHHYHKDAGSIRLQVLWFGIISELVWGCFKRIK